MLGFIKNAFGRQKKILIIEDEEVLYEPYRQKLGGKYNLIFAADGKKGLQLAVSEKPDVILLDLMLPGELNGFDFLRELKQIANLKQVPVIVLSNLEGEQQSVVEGGANEYLVKSNTSLDETAAHIEKYLTT